MDVKKVLQDLMARSERTSFENEREVCLEKIKMLLAKHAINDINAFLQSGETGERCEIPIEEIRNIFVAQFYPFFMDSAVIDEFDNVPVGFSKWDLEAIKNRCDRDVITFAKNAPSLAKVYGTFLNFVEGKLRELERRSSILGGSSWYDYIIVPREIAYWVNDGIGKYVWSSVHGTIEEVAKARVEKFLEDKTEFFERLHEGYYDWVIKNVIDIKALPSSEKPVDYSEKETASILSQMRGSHSFRTGPRSGSDQKKNKKPAKKKQESNWYVNLQSHSPF